MVILQRVGIMSLAKITTLFGVIHGIVAGLFWGYIVEMTGFALRRPGLAGLAGFGLFVLLLFGGAIMGLISGVVGGFLYNVFAGWAGGVQMEVR